MKLIVSKFLLAVAISVSLLSYISAQPMDRILVNGDSMWVSGSNVAWVNFARDLGPGSAQLSEFDLAFRTLRDNGGNSMRLWLHTTGAHTPAWSGNMVTGPGANAISNLRAILDLAEQNDIALLLSLWSFDMLRTSNGTTQLTRSHSILTQDENRASYINNALIPIVEAVKGHKAILAWEIFNEAEGMSVEFGWNSITSMHVPMSDIQKFVNQTTGAIKRTDPDVQVTTGIVSFNQLSDIYSNTAYMNYYRDDRLVAAGGDDDGTLDFYTVHYYGHSDSPFSRHADYFQVDKPIVLAEFFIKGDAEGVSKDMIYKRLYDNGYAGAMSWQWIDWRQNRDSNQNTWINTLLNTQYMYGNYRDIVDLTFDVRDLTYTFEITESVIEAGMSSMLRWKSRNTASITLNGIDVLPMTTLEVTPLETTDYILVLTHEDATVIRDTITIKVIPNIEVDRLTDVSLVQQTDGFYTKMHGTYTIESIIVNFKTLPQGNFTVSSSFDGMNWSVIEEVSVTSETNYTISDENGVSSVFLKVQSDSEFELLNIQAYGLLSEIQAPRLRITYPAEGEVFQVGTKITVTAEILDGSGTFTGAYFHVNGEQKLFRRFRPFIYSFDLTETGEYSVQVEIRETNFPNIFSLPITFTVPENYSKTLFEAEEATLSGDTQIQSMASASGGAYVNMQGSGSISWNNIVVTQDGEYTARFGYRLPFDYKENILSVNGVVVDTIAFSTPIDTWRTVDRKITLNKGTNTVSISHFWGYMWFDYMEIMGEGVSVNPPIELPIKNKLGANYPNPFNPTTIIPYELALSSRVIIEVFDLLGRKISSFDQGLQSTGEYQFQYNATGLSSGVYIYRLSIDNHVLSGQMLLIK